MVLIFLLPVWNRKKINGAVTVVGNSYSICFMCLLYGLLYKACCHHKEIVYNFIYLNPASDHTCDELHKYGFYRSYKVPF